MAQQQTRGLGIRGEVALTGVALAGNACLAFVITWLVARSYGAAAAGQFFVVTAIFVITAALLGMGTDTGMVRLLSRSKARGELDRAPAYLSAAVAPALLVGAALAMVVLTDVDRALIWSGLPADFRPIVIGMSLLVIPHSLLAVLLGGCRGLGDPLSYSVLQNIFVPVVRLVSIGAAVLAGGSVQVALWGWLVPPTLATALAALRLRQVLARARQEEQESWPVDHACTDQFKRTRPTQEHDTPEPSALRREFWSFSLPRGAAVVLERCIDWVDVLLVVALLGPTAGGIYGVVSRVVMSGALVETALSVVLGPRISATLAVHDMTGFRSLFRMANLLLVLAAWPVFLVLGIFAPHVLTLFGPEFVGGATALRILCLGLLAVTAAGMLQSVLLMSGRSAWQVRNRLVQLAVMVLGCVAMVPLWGVAGAAAAWTLGVVVNAAITAVQIHRLHATRQRPGTLARTAAGPVAYFSGVGIVLTPVLEASLPVGIAVGVLLSAGYPLVVGLQMRHRAWSLPGRTMEMNSGPRAQGWAWNWMRTPTPDQVTRIKSHHEERQR